MRRHYKGLECPEEEALLEEMDTAWFNLTREERDIINNEGPQTLISTGFTIRTLT